MNNQQNARNRVNQTTDLQPYASIIIDYDWHEEEEHYEWVATAPVGEIVAWAEGIRQDERED